MPRIPVTKCHGTGNDFVLLDIARGTEFHFPELARMLCDRRFGVGADGLLVVRPGATNSVDVDMRIFNADGSEAEMCGNGVRCVARYLHERRPDAPLQVAVQTVAGVVRAEIVHTNPSFAIRVAMGVPDSIFEYDNPSIIGGVRALLTEMSMGNPHSVAFVDDDPNTIDLNAFAKVVAESGPFSGGVNVEVARISEDSIAMRVHERGVGETWACGSGACAVAVAAIIAHRATSPVRILMRGGAVEVEWNGPDSVVHITGGAEIVFRTDIEVPDRLIAAAGALSG